MEGTPRPRDWAGCPSLSVSLSLSCRGRVEGICPLPPSSSPYSQDGLSTLFLSPFPWLLRGLGPPHLPHCPFHSKFICCPVPGLEVLRGDLGSVGCVYGSGIYPRESGKERSGVWGWGLPQPQPRPFSPGSSPQLRHTLWPPEAFRLPDPQRPRGRVGERVRWGTRLSCGGSGWRGRPRSCGGQSPS